MCISVISQFLSNKCFEEGKTFFRAVGNCSHIRQLLLLPPIFSGDSLGWFFFLSLPIISFPSFFDFISVQNRKISSRVASLEQSEVFLTTKPELLSP